MGFSCMAWTEAWFIPDMSMAGTCSQAPIKTSQKWICMHALIARTHAAGACCILSIFHWMHTYPSMICIDCCSWIDVRLYIYILYIYIYIYIYICSQCKYMHAWSHLLPIIGIRWNNWNKTHRIAHSTFYLIWSCIRLRYPKQHFFDHYEIF